MEIDWIQEAGAFYGAHVLWHNVRRKPAKYAPVDYVSRPKWFGGQPRKNGGTGRCPPDRRDHACSRLWMRLRVKRGHKLSGLRWYGSLSSRRPFAHPRKEPI